MRTVLSIIGTRPEAIKMAPVIKVLEKERTRANSVVCVTGQHRQMLDQVLGLFGIEPDIDLNLMQSSQTLSGVTSLLFDRLDKVVRDVQPDWILAQGDTSTVMVAGITAFYHRVKFGHVEAGLRTADKWRPFPEEINRRIADLVADAYFAPTTQAAEALVSEGCDPANIHITGNTVVDALLDIASRPFDWDTSALPPSCREGRLVVVTGHRRESFGEPFRELCFAIRELSVQFPDTNFIYPVHLNPNVREPVGHILSGIDNVHLIEPVDYLTMVHLMKRACLILTDSGGIQEEAPSLRVPVLVMRDTTERPEGVDAGVVRLVGTDRQRIISESRKVLDGDDFVKNSGLKQSPYGDGRAAQRIAEFILDGQITS